MEAYDILFPIIIRLPVKSLLRFQSVSKSWNTIISDKEFKKTHIDQSEESSSNKKLLLVHTDEGLFEFRDMDNPKIAMGKQEFPLQGFRNPTALCSCDCLVLMKKAMDENQYALWNPCTNEYRAFVCPYLSAMTPRAYGLCYDSSDDDYKVILIYKSNYVVYHGKRNDWTKKTIVSRKVRALDHERDCGQGISVDGYVFWSLDSNIKQLVRSHNRITYFDVRSDELKELPKPDFIGADQSFRLTCLKGCIGLYGYIYGNRTCELDIWIMEQDEWTQLMKINCFNSDLRYQYIRNIVLLGCTRNGEILFQAGRGLECFVMYDPKQHKFSKEVRISKHSKHNIIPICSASFYFPKHNIG